MSDNSTTDSGESADNYEQRSSRVERPPTHPNKRMCGRCGKVISTDGFAPERCHDCGGYYIRPTDEDLACDRCGGDDAGRVFGPTDHNRLCDDCVTAENVELSLPDYMDGVAWDVDAGIWVLTLSGLCSCGHSEWRVAPGWKVPAEHGGGYMTSECAGCLGTMEFSEQWERLDRVVGDYSDLRFDGGESA